MQVVFRIPKLIRITKSMVCRNKHNGPFPNSGILHRLANPSECCVCPVQVAQVSALVLGMWCQGGALRCRVPHKGIVGMWQVQKYELQVGSGSCLNRSPSEIFYLLDMVLHRERLTERR